MAASALVLSACGAAGGKSASVLRSPSPVNLSVYVNDSRVSVSPSSVGAGPVVFIVTNQSDHAQSLAISRDGACQALASTAPINPEGTTQVSVNFSPGNYTIAAAPHGQNDAQLSEPTGIAPASIHIGRQRASASNELLSP